MAEWRVQLRGNSSDLQELEQIFIDHDPTIVHDDDNFYLKSARWERFREAEAENIRNEAKKLIELLDRAAYIHFRDAAPIAIDHVVRIGDDGRKKPFVFGEAVLTLRPARLRATATVTGPDGQSIQNKREHTIIRVLRQLERYPLVADALMFLRKGDWVSLYKAYEIVRDEVHGNENILHHGWLTRKSISRFTQTAQSREALGDDARHASRKYKSPKEPMSIHEARAIIGDLLQKWIDSL